MNAQSFHTFYREWARSNPQAERLDRQRQTAKRNYPRASPRRRKYWMRLQCAAEKSLMAAFHKANP